MMRIKLSRALVPLGAAVCTLLVALTYVSTQKAHAATRPQTVNVHCSSAQPCADVRSTGAGLAINAAASNNTTVAAATSAANTLFGSLNGVQFSLTGGIVGNDVNGSYATDNNSGVLGFSLYGSGVQGVTYNACCPFGTDVTTFGAIPAVFGLDAAPGTGLAGGGNVGVAGRSLTRVGGLFLSRSGYGAVGRSFTGTGVLGVSRAAGGVALAATSLMGGPIFQGFNATQQVASIDSNGDLTIAGSLRTGETPAFAARAANGNSVTTYGARQSIATVEDFGRGMLRAGSAQVQIDPAFAQIMDPASSYMVFITPEGDNHGLFVANRNAAGFRVLESQGGHSTLSFSYRIVAHAFGAHEARLGAVPVMPAVTHPAAAAVQSTRARAVE